MTERSIALKATRRYRPCGQGIIEFIGNIAANDDLGRVTLAHILRPGIPKIAEAFVKQPSMKPPLKSVQLDVLSEIELESAIERIRVEAIQSQLVQVAHIALYEEVDLPVRSTSENEAFAGFVGKETLLLFA